MNKRETILALITLGILPASVKAQAPKKVFRIGIVSLLAFQARFAALIAPALRELGYEEGRNIEFDFRQAEGRTDQLPSLVADLARKVDLILAAGNLETEVAKRATSSVPIVVAYSLVPVEAGLVASLARPGGNVTGTTLQGPETAGKMMEVLRDAVPGTKRVTYLWEPDYPGMDLYRRPTERAAAAMGIRLTGLSVRTLADLDAALPQIIQQRPDALLIVISGAIFTHRARIIEFAASQRLPALYTSPQPVLEGGLISYTADYVALARRTAAIIDRILKGAKPSELPVEQPSRFELVINMQTAKTLGLKIPQSLLLRADRVIE